MSCSVAAISERDRLRMMWKSAKKRGKFELMWLWEMGRMVMSVCTSTMIFAVVWWILRRAAPRISMLVRFLVWDSINFSNAGFQWDSWVVYFSNVVMLSGGWRIRGVFLLLGL